MDHNTFAKQCDETMAAINKLTASYHHLEKPEWAKGSEDKLKWTPDLGPVD